MDGILIYYFQSLAFAALVVFLLRLLVLTTRKAKYRYPSGPRPLPLIGNLLDVPRSESWVTYTRWGHDFGDTIYLNALGTPIVVLNSYTDCVNLFEKRSNIYSDRHQLPVISSMGGGDTVILSPYGDRWRKYRRMCALLMRKETVKQFHSSQARGVAEYLQLLADDPSDYKYKFRFIASRGISFNMYGIEISDLKDPIVAVAEVAGHYAVLAAQPGKFIADFFPPLLRLPEWLPGMAFKVWARCGAQALRDMINLPYEFTVQDMKSGTHNTSFTAAHIENGEDKELIKWCTGTMFSAAVDTSVATMTNFFLAMTLHPECQQRAQAEIDALCGNERLPNFDDRSSLPYTDALMKEVLRWQPVAPIAIPHKLMRDDVYKDMILPGGSIVIGNTWAISRDTRLFETPDKFLPERYLPVEGKEPPLDPQRFAFGYGRRICAGMHYADSMMFIAMSRILATFDITPHTDADGKKILPELKFTSLMLREPVPFKCTIQPRSTAAVDLIRSSL